MDVRFDGALAIGSKHRSRHSWILSLSMRQSAQSLALFLSIANSLVTSEGKQLQKERDTARQMGCRLERSWNSPLVMLALLTDLWVKGSRFSKHQVPELGMLVDDV